MVTRLKKFFYEILDFPKGWIAVLGILILDRLWASPALKLPFPLLAGASFLVFLNIKILYQSLIAAEILKSQRITSFFRDLFLGVEYILLYLSGGFALAMVCYLACAFNYPFVDQQLSYIDQAIGFNWSAIFQWAQIQPICSILQMAYTSLQAQFFLFVFWFVLQDDQERLYEIFWVLFVSLFLTALVSGFLPALGPAQALGLDTVLAHLQPDFSKALKDVMSVRSGNNIDIQRLNGIVTFPSFHTICALVFTYGFRKTGGIGWMILLLNLIVLLSIPVFGDHYLIDMIAGAAVALLSVIIVRLAYPVLYERRAARV